MSDSLESLRTETLARIDSSISETDLEQLRVEALGRKGRLTTLLRGLKNLPAQDRPRAGEQLNHLRQLLEDKIEERLRYLKTQAKEKALREQTLDITLPGNRWERGRTHPLSLVV